MSEKVTEVGIKWKIFKFKKHILIYPAAFGLFRKQFFLSNFVLHKNRTPSVFYKTKRPELLCCF